MAGCMFNDLAGSPDSVRMRNEFHTRGPLEDRLGTRMWNGIKRFAMKVAVALALTTGTVNMPACSQETQETQRREVVTRAALTDENGRATFDIYGIRYELNVTDSETGEGVPNMLGILSATEEGGLYIVYDQEGDRYSPAMTGVSAEDEDAESYVRMSNVVVEIPETPCNAPRRFLVSGRSPAELYDDRYLEDENKSVIQTLFGRAGNSDNVALSELDNSLGQVIEAIREDLIGRGIEGGAIQFLLALGIKLSAETENRLNAFGLITTALEACAIADTLDWASYYRGLCYEDDDRFEIWVLSGFEGIEIGTGIPDVDISLLRNPVLIILPVERPDNDWEAPVAHINGRVDLSQAPSLNMPRTVRLEHVDGSIPTLEYIIPGSEDRFFFDAGACENYNPEYGLTVTALDPLHLFSAELSTSLHVSDDEEYEIGFYPAEGCEMEGDYFTSYMLEDEICDPYDIAVSCTSIHGYVTAEECDWEDIDLLECTDTEIAGQYGFLSFSLDEGKIAFSSDGIEISVYDIETGNRNEIAEYRYNYSLDDGRLISTWTSTDEHGYRIVNIENGDIINITEELHSWSGCIFNYSLSGNNFVFVSEGTGIGEYGDIYLSDLTRGNIDLIVEEGNSVSIHGNYVAYAETRNRGCPPDENVPIRLYDINTASNYDLDGNGRIPRIYGNNVVYYDYVQLSGGLDMYSLQLVNIDDPTNPQRTEIMNETISYHFSNNVKSYGIYGDYVAFSSHGRAEEEIRLYHIPTGETRVVYEGIVAEDNSSGSTVQIDGRYIVFMEGDTSGQRIYVCEY
ncbi:hypothetical protein KKF81_06200 [Candidatus Micrarchaeota archaeon]|nr:hypothetical protein [Candidatus Micrarchaeota archaeon]MBU1166521.1 hypothetical protein [Candidatus Micrarchaeota archaeon]MBU1887533.1 hypothetical protein [Candidatus Micrarchaeota archaeon]